MKRHALLISLILFFAPGAFAQQRPITCEETRDRALTRVTIVSNSRVLMEEDLAVLSVSLRYARERMGRMNAELKTLREQMELAKKKDETETKQSKAETKATEVETKGAEPETETAKPETITEEPTQ